VSNGISEEANKILLDAGCMTISVPKYIYDLYHNTGYDYI